MREPLTMTWKQAWKVYGRDEDRLHRVALVRIYDVDKWGEWDGYIELTHIDGITCCGLAGRLSMLGIFGRMARERCAHCCRAAGVERGGGIPGNGGECGPVDAWQVEP